MSITTYIDASHSIVHNRVIIIGKEIVITGSFKFAKAAKERYSSHAYGWGEPDRYF